MRSLGGGDKRSAFNCIEEVWIERGVRGVQNVMLALGSRDPGTRWITL